MRKPKPLLNEWVYIVGSRPTESCVKIDGLLLEQKDCRKLAAWLIKAADWLDEQESGKKKGSK